MASIGFSNLSLLFEFEIPDKLILLGRIIITYSRLFVFCAGRLSISQLE